MDDSVFFHSQPSAVSGQRSAVSGQRSAVSRQLLAHAVLMQSLMGETTAVAHG
ncbi:hypothetical protein [Moorena producens]|uniref:hypothetical protein n=1 Tax=Moorena producens TaxID=1155739 RepID=UPI003C7621C5